MAPPRQVVDWVKRKYPKPSVDPEWLEACYSWIESDLKLSPSKDLDAIFHNVELQLLQSSLAECMLPGTGLPANIASPSTVTVLRGPPILVEIISITEIGHSAFTLQNVRQARIERADLAGLSDEEGNNEEDENRRIPKYPRSMLRFQLSDGVTVLPAIEYRPLPDLKLGVTPLGFKMLLKDVRIQNGIAFLEPAKVVMKGWKTEELEEVQDADFVRSLRLRLGLPVAEDVPATAEPLAVQPPRTTHTADPLTTRTTQHTPSRRPTEHIRSPLREPPEPGSSRSFHDDDAEQPRRRKLPAREHSPAPTRPILTHSLFFAVPPSPPGGGREHNVNHTDARRVSKRKQREGGDTSLSLGRVMELSPHRQSPLFLADSDEETSLAAANLRPSAFTGRKVSVRLDDDVMTETGLRNASPGPASSEFGDIDFDFEANDELLATLDKVEREYADGGSSVSHTATRTLTRTPASGTNSREQNGTESRPTQVVDLSIDDEEDEKENVPAHTRHVRRRVMRLVEEDDIIEISD